MDALRWDDVRYFLALSREGSLTATAKLLGVEHTTVARRVVKLEETLKIKLFDRLTKAWVLTAEGELLAEQATALEEAMQSLWRTAQGNGALSGVVRLSAPPALIHDFLTPRLPQFQERYPDILLELIGETRSADLMRSEADIALRLAEPQGNQLVRRRLCDVTYNFYATADWLERPEPEWVFIGFDQNSTHRQRLWLEDYLKCRRVILQTNDMRVMHQAALAGIGVALLPRFLLHPDSRPQLVAVGHENLTCPLYLVMHADVRLGPRIRATADFLVELFHAEGHTF